MKPVTGNPYDADAVEARQRQILGAPVRLKPLERMTDEALAMSNHIRATIGSGRPPSTDMADVPEMLGISLKHPELYRRQIELGIQINGRDAKLPVRDREIAILRVAWLCQAPFEWGSHVKIGKGRGGMTDEEVARVAEGSAAEGWDEHDRALLRAVEELIADAYISDETWAVLATRYDEAQLLELPALIGTYQTTAYIQNSVRYRLTEGNVGLTAR